MSVLFNYIEDYLKGPAKPVEKKNWNFYLIFRKKDKKKKL